MNDDENLATSRLKGDQPFTDPEAGYSKSFKNKFVIRRSYYKLAALVILIFTVLVIAIIGILWYAHIIDSKAINQNTKICTTEKCLRSAVSFVESMNRSVDPCEDFYQFACGRYGNMHRIPKTSNSNDRFSEVHTRMVTHIVDFLEKEDSSDDPYALSQSRLLYRSCMATDEMDAAGIQPMIQILNKIGLPYLDFTSNNHSSEQTNSRVTVSTILANVKKELNIDFLFTTIIEPDRKNRTINKMALGKPIGSEIFPVHKVLEKIGGMSSKKKRKVMKRDDEMTENESEESENDDSWGPFEKYFQGVWKEIFKHQSNKYDPNALPDKKLINQVAIFLNELQEINYRVYDTDLGVPSYMTVNELQEYTNKIARNYSQTNELIINWKQYFTSLFVGMYEDMGLDFENETIQITSIEYFEDLFKLLVNTTENQLITNVWWKVVTTLVPYTNNQMRFLEDRYLYEFFGLENNPSRSTYCANAVNEMMGMVVSRLLMDSINIYDDINMVDEMMANIYFAFEKIVEELNWMDDLTKNLTLSKTKMMKTSVGFPEIIIDTIDLDNYYNDFEVLENNYFENVIHYVQREFNNSLMAFRVLNDFSVNQPAVYNALEVNAFYSVHKNAITIPAGILQFPFFGHDLQMLNYGSLGTILGHELTHGFDNSGHKYDASGNENMWWTNKTADEYEKHTQCFIDHYESYLVPGIDKKVSGKMTLDENIADNGGIREALWAYREFVAGHGEEPKLPGLEEFTNEQLFFISYANNWCEASTSKSLLDSLLDVHSPNYIRVIAGLTNSQEFSEVWKCAKGTRMNPIEEKCKIW